MAGEIEQIASPFLFWIQPPSGQVDMFDDSITNRSYHEARTDASPEKKYKVEDGKLTYTYKVLSDKAQKVHVVYNGEYILDYGIKFKD